MLRVFRRNCLHATLGGQPQRCDANIGAPGLEGREAAHHVDLHADLLDPIADLEFDRAFAQFLESPISACTAASSDQAPTRVKMCEGRGQAKGLSSEAMPLDTARTLALCGE